MAVHEILLECLENLDSEELDLFKWHLTQGVNDFKIPKSQLENQPRCAIAECMIKRFHTDGAGELTLLVLKKMNQMNPAKELREKLGINEDSLQSKHTADAGAAQKQERRKPDEFNTDSSAFSKSSFITQWMRRLIEAMGQSAIARLEAPHMPSTSEMKKLRINRKDQERSAGLKGAEFVEKHRTELINRVSLVAPIADDMKDLIGDEKYQIIFNSVTPQERMRKLLDFITTTKLKDKLYQSLLKHEHSLVEELQHSE